MASVRICALSIVTLVLLTIGLVQGADPTKPAAFLPVDTARFMGSPDNHRVFGVEDAFPHLSFERPVDLTHAGDGTNRMFAVEQDGRIRVWANSPDTKSAATFLDIRKDVRREHNEEGLLGLAFHPKYRENGQFFVFYSITPRGSRVSRFQVSKADPELADPESEEVLLEFPKPYGNHNGGSLQFGPDGFLYISVGDGGLADDPHENAQNLETLQGSILRIDVDRKAGGQNYAVPRDNPFADRGGKVRGEIWAYGLRNVWRMSFDRETGLLWGGDVGQDHREEIDVITRGGNYGWNTREGKHPRDAQEPRDSNVPFLEPVFEYPRLEGKSITGGFVYRGKRLPTLRGAYVYADFMSGNIWALEWDGKRATANHKIARTSFLISAFGEDQAGELYFTALDGKIRRFKTPEAASPANFPRTLTETGLFRSVKDHEPIAGLIPYDVNVPLWSDGAEKDRFIALPRGGEVVFRDKQQWQFPVGTVIVKTFSLPTDTQDLAKRRRLETRLWIHSPRGWDGVTYMWNEEQSEANLLADWPLTREFEIQTPEGPKKQDWYFPSRSDCHACHTEKASFVLGLNTRQLNRNDTFAHGESSQIDRFARLGLFAKNSLPNERAWEAYPDWEDSKASLEDRARAYLDVNCALCHKPGAFGMAGGSQADLDYHRSFREAFPEVSAPNGKPWVVKGLPEKSRLIQRMQARHSKEQMPPLATNIPDTQAIELISRWIQSLEK